MDIQITRAICGLAMVGMVSIPCSLAAQRNIDPSIAVPDHAGLPVVKVRAQTLSSDTAIGQPTFLTISGAILWVSDRKGNPHLHAIDTATGRVIRSVGRTGEGPEEFRQVLSIFPDFGSEPAIRVWDEKYRLMRVSLAAPLGVVPGFVTVAQRQPSYVFPTGRRGFVGLRYSDSAALVFFDSTGKVTRTTGASLPGADSIARRERLIAFSGAHLCSKTNGNGFAMTHVKYSRITFLDSTGVKSLDAAVPYPSEALFVRDAVTGAVRFRKTRDHYQGCTFSDRHLFALYLGKSAASTAAAPASSGSEGRYVHVFDSRGVLIRVLDLGVEMAMITVDRAGRTLYGTSWTDAIVYKVSIPPL